MAQWDKARLGMLRELCDLGLEWDYIAVTMQTSLNNVRSAATRHGIERKLDNKKRWPLRAGHPLTWTIIEPAQPWPGA